MLHFGICVVTCDRPQSLDSTIKSMGKAVLKHRVERVVVDNGRETCDEVSQIAKRYGFYLIDGGQSNAPHGQNKGFTHLSNCGCDVILKADDDVTWEEGAIPRMLQAFESNIGSVGAVGCVIYSKDTSKWIQLIGGDFIGPKREKIDTESVMRYRMRRVPSLLRMKHLHCSYLYSVAAARELKQRTYELRRGVFLEGLSAVAFREETEFTYLLYKFLRKDVLLCTDVYGYHHYAPGGIRKVANFDDCVCKDEAHVTQVVESLIGKRWNIVPAWVDLKGKQT